MSSSTSLFDEIASGAVAESPLWEAALLAPSDRNAVPVFSPLLPDPAFAVGLETIYEGYLLHYGRSRLFESDDPDVLLLLGDALLAHGLVRIAATGSIQATADLSALLSLCAQARAERRPGDGAAWAATAAALGTGTLDEARDALRLDGDPGPLEALARAEAGDEQVASALAAHGMRV